MTCLTLHKTSQCGLRESNEDVERYFFNMDENGKPINKKYAPIDFFLVCDGHGGKQVAEFIAPIIQEKFTNRNMYYPIDTELKNKIFDELQLILIRHPRNIAKNCGCTCLIMVRFFNFKSRRKYIQLFNAGDSRAVLSKNGLAIALTKDHKPIWPDEKKRIFRICKANKEKGKIYYDGGDWRVGDLSVSRSLGDLDNTPYVTHIPDTFLFKLNENDEFVILACDGLWDVVQNHEAVNFVKDHKNNNHTEFYQLSYPNSKNDTNIARKLAHYAIAKGSTDNVSILIVFFR
jgi:serine/threonine protein phosphatase PrpC